MKASSKLRLSAGLVLVWAAIAMAQTLAPPTPQFAFTGFIQAATLDTTGAICTPAPQSGLAGPLDVSRLRGGTITVNGITMIVPCNTILQLPAATFTFAELFDPTRFPAVGTYIGWTLLGSPVPANPVLATDGRTGLALADNPMPFPAFDVNVVGNVVGKNLDGTDRYIVGMIAPIEQQVLNGSSGIITCIDYATGAFRVGGTRSTLAGGACPAGVNPSIPGGDGALVQINDPNGRWGLPHSPDPRFSGDDENVTVHASTGIPVCIPRVAPPLIDDLCPLKNRPLNSDLRFGASDPFLAAAAPRKIFTMATPAQADLDATLPDPRQQVPMMVGDQVNYVGTVYKINPTATYVDPVSGLLVPDNRPSNIYMSAHTVEDVLGIFTQPGVPPAYVFVEAFLIGSGGAAVQGILQEASTRLTVVGFTTDPTRLVDIYAQDLNPCTGQESLRLLATTDPATQPMLGRFVHRVLGGLFMPPTRYYVVKSRTQFADAFGQPLPDQPLMANGIVPGMYLLPNFEFVVPENHKLGDPIIPANFQDFPFLALGSGPLDGFDSGTAIVGQLSPWPGIPVPPLVNCTGAGHLPIPNAGPDRAVGVNAAVILNGSVDWDPNSVPASHTVLWTQISGTPTVTLTNPTSLNTSFTAPSAPTASPLIFRLTATDNFGASVLDPAGLDQVAVTVLPTSDIVSVAIATWAPQKGKRGGFGKLDVTATTSDPTAVLSLTSLNVDPALVCPTAGGTTGTCDYGPGSNSPTAPTVFVWREIKGAPQPSTLTITSTKGGAYTATCLPPDAKGNVVCQ